MGEKEFTVEDYLKPKFDLSKVCGGCRFFKIAQGVCSEKDIIVSFETPKCDKWRYFA